MTIILFYNTALGGIMEIFVVVLVVLFALGATDLLVGVSNDAVNFTNSAIGSKAAKRKYILIIATIGIFIGAVSSAGMMEVARKGIFHPSGYTLAELMYLFLSVMLSDIILLDLYNTLGLPTSTTVSLVFELFGAALILALWKEGTYSKAIELINSAGAIKIISGIVLSIIVAFISGAVVQILVRSIFTFDYNRYLKKFGGIYAGFALTAITFFIIFKGLKDASFMTLEAKTWINQNIATILIVSLIIWISIFQFFVNKGYQVLKAVVLVGTGALAMAFAGNDLVNFIGVPMAGYNTYQLISQSQNPLQSGAALAGKVPTEMYLLVIAALIMIVTLWLSKKAQTVTQTEISLGSQEETVELFSNSNPIARVFIQIVLGIIDFFGKIIPSGVKGYFNSRFDSRVTRTGLNGRPPEEIEAFDLLRASVNIMTASILIMIATSMKLPLSTTYVTFMVSMGSSLSDRAWGRDNAVARVSGVLTVVGGWFMTAVIASFTAGIIISLLYLFGIYAMTGLLAFAGYLLYMFKKLHQKRDTEYHEKIEEMKAYKTHPEKAFQMIWQNIHTILQKVNKELYGFCDHYEAGKAGKIRKIKQNMNQVLIRHNPAITHIIELAERHFSEKDVKYIPHMTKSYSDVTYIIENIKKISHTAYEKISTYQTGLNKKEAEDLKEVCSISREMIDYLSKSLPDTLESFTKVKALVKKAKSVREKVSQAQIKRIKNNKSKAKTSIAYLIIVDEFGDLIENMDNLLDNIKKMKPLIQRIV